MRWDIFCRVIDNYGDAGVCWRLAADLAQRGEQVSLWIDDLRLIDQLTPAQGRAPVAVHPWQAAEDRFESDDIADVVIEAFACDPPAAYITAMAERAPTGKAPIWINLEYLSAEDWVGAHHKLPSPHPRYPLTKYFYFPGFTSESGGLLREPGLLASDVPTEPSPQSLHEPLRIFLFSYAQPALSDWIAALTHTVLDVAPCPAAQQLGHDNITAPSGVSIRHTPFVPQSEFDSLLQAHDLLFVRGEDSFVRAQWAGKPVFWQIYPQDDDAHLVKLRAFYARYLASEHLDSQQRDVVMNFLLAWNGAAPPAECARLWPEIVRLLPALIRNAQAWRQTLLQQPDLVTQLREFVGNLVK